MEEESRPWKRKRTDEEEESCKSTGTNPGDQGSSSASSGSCGMAETGSRNFSQCNCHQNSCNCIQNGSCKSSSVSDDSGRMDSEEFCGHTFDKNTLNCNQNCTAIQPGSDRSSQEFACRLDLAKRDCNQSNSNCFPSHSNIDHSSKKEISSKTHLCIDPLQRVSKSTSYSHIQNSLLKNSLDNPKLSLVQCSSKFTPNVQMSSNTCSSNDNVNNSRKCAESASTLLQGSSKVHLCECNSEMVKSSDGSMNSCFPVNSDPKLNSDPFWNACSCSSSFDETNPSSSRTKNSPHEICNPGFEVLNFPVRRSNSQSDPESGEVDGESGETEESGGTARPSKQTRDTGVKGDNCDNERSSVTELIASRRVAKFRIQKSLSENSQDVGGSWNSWSVPSNDAINICDNVNSDNITLSPNDNLKCESHNLKCESHNLKCESNPENQDNEERLRFKQWLSTGSSNDKGACPELTDAHHINRLPAPILVNILRHLRMCDLLHRASLVCKLWHQLVYDPDIWRRIDFRYQHKVTDRQLLTLTQISDRVTHMDISDTQNLTSDALESSLKRCGHLRSLHMSRCYNLRDVVLQTVGRHCGRLTTLVMDGCYKVRDEGLCAMAEGCKKLRKINLSRCSHHVTDTGVSAIAENCPVLKEVILAYLSEVTDTSCVKLCEMCPELEVVTLMFSGVSEKGVRALKQLKRLRIVDISSLPGILPADVATLTQYCPDLEAMNVSLNPQINDECLLQLIKHGRKLHLLQCVSCHVTDLFLGEVGKHTQALKNLDIGWCQAVTDEGIRTLSATCPTLQYLGLIRCDSVTAEGVEELVAKYPNITYSTFILESKKLIERARREGFMFNDDQNHVDMLV